MKLDNIDKLIANLPSGIKFKKPKSEREWKELETAALKLLITTRVDRLKKTKV